MLAELWEWMRAVWRHWVGLASGAVSFLFGFWVKGTHKPDIDPRIFWIGTALCLFWSFFLAWRDEHRVRADLEARIAPKLFVEFDARIPPYFEEQDLGTVVNRCFRIGVRNKSELDVHGIRVVLESCNHPTAAGIHLDHKLQVTDAAYGTDSAPIAPGQRAVFDVASEIVQTGRVTELHLCYASRPLNLIDRAVVWRITLRAEGAGPVARRTFILREDAATRTWLASSAARD